MSEGPKADLERGLGLGLSLVAALIGVTCGSRGAIGPSASPVPSLARTPVALTRSTVAAPYSEPPRTPEANPAPSPRLDDSPHNPALLDLPRFYSQLWALEQHRRKTPVRIVWFGDSHTAADFLTGALRARLQARFGAAGPGFVRVGVKQSRHTQIHFGLDGDWKVEPVPPSRRTPFGDGQFGLAGERAFPEASPAHASFEVARGSAHGELRWQLWFSLPAGASFRVTLSGSSQLVNRASGETELPGAGFASLALQSGLEDKLALDTLTGAPRFYGLTVEGSEPGVVLDALGIDGARIATTLAWGEGSFEAALRARAPSLVAFAFGTNEAFDADPVEKYRPEYVALLTRVRNAAPESECLIVGPPDANAASGGSEPRVAEIDRLERSIAAGLGCGFASQLQIMGGSGAYTAWMKKSPQLARGDRLHLSPKGYELIGNAIADRLLDAYHEQVASGSMP